MQLLEEETVRYYYQYLNLQKVGWDFKDWIDMAQDRDRWGILVNAVMKLWVP
jgi:hypothetical protein